MENYVRTDLACEAFESMKDLPRGARGSSETVGGIRVSRVRIQERSASEALGKPCGTYVGYHGRKLNLLSLSEEETLVRLLSGELCGMAARLCHKKIDPDFSVLIVGLGNRELTSDALGPFTVSRLTATRHLPAEEGELYRSLKCCLLSAMAPGVLGQTGIEALELLAGTARSVSPDLIVAVDALAARSCAHLATTVQVSDTGICPGSGVGNHRSELSRKTLGVPVISVGIPTVVHSSTLVWDALREAGIEETDETLHRVLESRPGFFVTPKDCDCITKAGGRIIARAISLAFTEALTEEC